MLQFSAQLILATLAGIVLGRLRRWVVLQRRQWSAMGLSAIYWVLLVWVACALFVLPCFWTADSHQTHFPRPYGFSSASIAGVLYPLSLLLAAGILFWPGFRYRRPFGMVAREDWVIILDSAAFIVAGGSIIFSLILYRTAPASASTVPIIASAAMLLLVLFGARRWRPRIGPALREVGYLSADPFLSGIYNLFDWEGDPPPLRPLIPGNLGFSRRLWNRIACGPERIPMPLILFEAGPQPLIKISVPVLEAYPMELLEACSASPLLTGTRRKWSGNAIVVMLLGGFSFFMVSLIGATIAGVYWIIRMDDAGRATSWYVLLLLMGITAIIVLAIWCAPLLVRIWSRVLLSRPPEEGAWDMWSSGGENPNRTPGHFIACIVQANAIMRSPPEDELRALAHRHAWGADRTAMAEEALRILEERGVLHPTDSVNPVIPSH